MNKRRITVLRVCIKLTIMLHIVNWTSNPRIRDWRVLYIGARGNVPLDQIYLFQTTSPNDTVGAGLVPALSLGLVPDLSLRAIGDSTERAPTGGAPTLLLIDSIM